MPSLREIAFALSLTDGLALALRDLCPALTALELATVPQPGSMVALALPALPALAHLNVVHRGDTDSGYRAFASNVGRLLRGRTLDSLRVDFVMAVVADLHLLVDALTQSAALPATLIACPEPRRETWRCEFGDTHLVRLAGAPGASNLRSLDVHLDDLVASAGMRALATLSGLRHLHLRARSLSLDAVSPWVVTQLTSLHVWCADTPAVVRLVIALGDAAPSLPSLRTLHVATTDPLPASTACALGALPLRDFTFKFCSSRSKAAAAATVMRAWLAHTWRGRRTTTLARAFVASEAAAEGA
eukprot:TRINITY_DN9201_c0_g1_i1.p1 TRINITY_DN9201_c0_g1~~TRINITY_DN9201_c0_g1_i1.p1  ORF type:complete len:342 (-),score=63.13 TRINITY_DN9201_c0_g1_i1:189-1094(-)